MRKAPSKVENLKQKITYNSKEQWLISCLNRVGINIETIIERRLERLEKALDVHERAALRYTIIASIIAQNGIKLTKLASGNLEYLSIDGKVVSIWNNSLGVGFDVEE